MGRGVRRWFFRLFWLGLAALLVCAAVTVGATTYFASRGVGHIERGSADVIIVLSAGVSRDSVQLDDYSRARVEAGVDLWRRGVAPEILMSGGPDLRVGIHLAEAMKRYAISLGAPEPLVLVEGNSISTFENARFTLDVARDQNWRRAVVVTDDFHLLRAWTLFQFWSREDDVEIVALAAADGRARAGAASSVAILARETLAYPWNVLKIVGQLALDAVGHGDDGMIR